MLTEDKKAGWSVGAKAGVCDVCRLLDGDRSSKAVHFCPRCDANLCQRCFHSPVRRARAAMKRAMGGDEEHGR